MGDVVLEVGGATAKVKARWSGGAPHAGLAVAAAEGGEGDERGDVPGPIGSLQRLGILFPSSHLHFVIWPSYFSSFFTRRSSYFFSSPLVTSFLLAQVHSSSSSSFS